MYRYSYIFFFLLTFTLSAQLFSDQSLRLNIPSAQVELLEEQVVVGVYPCSLPKEDQRIDATWVYLTTENQLLQSSGEQFRYYHKERDVMANESCDKMKQMLFANEDGREILLKGSVKTWDLGKAVNDPLQISISIENFESLEASLRTHFPPRFHIYYETIDFSPKSQELALYFDVYNRVSNPIEHLYQVMNQKAVNTQYLDKFVISKNLQIMDRRLKSEPNAIEAKVWKGQIKEIWEPMQENIAVLGSSLSPHSCLYNAMRAQDIPAGHALMIGKRAEEYINTKALQAQDQFEIVVKEGLIDELKIIQRNRVVEIPLSDLHLGLEKLRA